MISLRYIQIGLRWKFWEVFLRKDGYTDEMSYGSILKACSASASAEKGEKWFRRMLSQGLRPNVVVMCSSIAACRSRWMMMVYDGDDDDQRLQCKVLRRFMPSRHLRFAKLLCRGW